MSDGVEALLHHESGEREVAVQRLRAVAWLVAGVGALVSCLLWKSALWPALTQLGWGFVSVAIALRAPRLRRWPAIGVGLSAVDAVLVARRR